MPKNPAYKNSSSTHQVLPASWLTLMLALDSSLLPPDPEPSLFGRLQRRPKAVLCHVYPQLFFSGEKLDIESSAYDGKAEQHLQLHPMPSRTLVDPAAKGNPSSTVAVEGALGLLGLQWARAGDGRQRGYAGGVAECSMGVIDWWGGRRSMRAAIMA